MIYRYDMIRRAAICMYMYIQYVCTYSKEGEDGKGPTDTENSMYTITIYKYK